MLKQLLLGAGMFVGVNSTLAKHTTIGSAPEGSGFTQGIGIFGFFGGKPGHLFGQTFTTPSGQPVLERLTFWSANSVYFDSEGNQLPTQADRMLFSLVLTGWNGSGAEGGILYRSDARVGPSQVSPYARYDFHTDRLQLDPARQYLAFLIPTGRLPAAGGELPVHAWGSVAQFSGKGDRYAGGHRVTNHDYGSTDPTSAVSGERRTAWSGCPGCPGYDDDLAFQAQFSTVAPEPASMALLGTGLAGVATIRRRRSRRRAEQG